MIDARACILQAEHANRYPPKMPNVQVRHVPDDVHRRLKSQAALSGQSLNEFLLARMTDIASVPTVSELAERIRARAPYEGPSSASAIRAARDR
jgi:plasmid stability protein